MLDGRRTAVVTAGAVVAVVPTSVVLTAVLVMIRADLTPEALTAAVTDSKSVPNATPTAGSGRPEMALPLNADSFVRDPIDSGRADRRGSRIDQNNKDDARMAERAVRLLGVDRTTVQFAAMPRETGRGLVGPLVETAQHRAGLKIRGPAEMRARTLPGERAGRRDHLIETAARHGLALRAGGGKTTTTRTPTNPAATIGAQRLAPTRGRVLHVGMTAELRRPRGPIALTGTLPEALEQRIHPDSSGRGRRLPVARDLTLGRRSPESPERSEVTIGHLGPSRPAQRGNRHPVVCRRCNHDVDVTLDDPTGRDSQHRGRRCVGD